jgi:hypothetical protein
MTQQAANVPFAGDTVNHESVEVETTKTEESVETPKAEELVPEKEVTPEEQLKQLEEFRSKGNISMDMTYEQFKKMRNTFKNDIEWQGPNQAMLLSILMLNLEQGLASMDPKNSEPQKVSIRNESVESISFFVNLIKGKNSHSAQNSLGMFLSIQQAVAQLQSIDKQIEVLKGTLDTKSKKSKK